jgi:repressor LexA
MLTRKQHELLTFINQRLAATGVAPSFDEMKGRAEPAFEIRASTA